MTESACASMRRKGIVKHIQDRLGSDLPVILSLLMSVLMVLGALLRAGLR